LYDLRIRAFTRLGDYSYGLYIYAFPLQQQMVFYHPGLKYLEGFAVVYPIILGVAILSWHLIEKPALGLKKYFRARPSFSDEETSQRDVSVLSASA
jgi:peptidoglycan/LPS O-acetylase OafA/YrhL